MFRPYAYNTTSGSCMNESNCAASSEVRLVMDTVVAVSIFALLGVIISLLAEVSVVILAVVGIVIAAVLLAAVIIESPILRRPEQVKG